MKVRAVWQFFEVEREGNSIALFAPGGASRPRLQLRTPARARTALPERLCFARTKGARDHFALFVVSAGEGIRQRAEEAKNSGHYFRSHALQALAIETAEACAEWLHRRIREDWGFPDPPR